MMMDRRERPRTSAACTNSRVRNDSTSARTTRATGGQETMAMAATIEPRLGEKIATSTTARTKLGTVWKNSVKRMIASSMQAAGVAGDGAEGDADQHRNDCGDAADQQRDARAVGDAGGDVAAEAVGAERESPASPGGRMARRACPRARTGRGRRRWREDRDEDQHDDAGYGAAVARRRGGSRSLWVLPLPLRERVGVRGWGQGHAEISRAPTPHPSPLPKGRGRV